MSIADRVVLRFRLSLPAFLYAFRRWSFRVGNPKIAIVFPSFTLLKGPSRLEDRLGPVMQRTVLVLEPSSCRVVKEQVLRWFEPVPGCMQGLAVEPGIPVVLVERRFQQEQVEETQGIVHHNMPTVPLSILVAEPVAGIGGPALALLGLLQLVQELLRLLQLLAGFHPT